MDYHVWFDQRWQQHGWFRGFYFVSWRNRRVIFNEGFGPLNFSLSRRFYYFALRNPMHAIFGWGPNYIRIWGGPGSAAKRWRPRVG